MHLGILSGLIVALTTSFWGGSAAHASGTVYQTNLDRTAALYSILAQSATTPTIATGTTPTTVISGTAGAAGTITATSVVTGSGSLTATVTLTNTSPTVPPATAIPLPSAPPPSNLQINPLDWNFLTGTPTDPKLGPFGIAFVVIMLVLIGAAIYFYRVRAPQWKGTNPVLFKAVNRFAGPALWIGILGLLFVIFRLVPIDFFNLRFWFYLDFLALIGLGIWMYYWSRNSYPKEMAKFQKTQKARQYMPGGGGRTASRSTAVGTQQAKGSQQPKASPGPRPAQQGSKNRKKR